MLGEIQWLYSTIVDRCPAMPTSEMGQSRRFDRMTATSGLPRRTDILRVGGHVSKVPAGDSGPAIGRTCGVAVNECRKAEAMN
jgi:hypothetical protein